MGNENTTLLLVAADPGDQIVTRYLLSEIRTMRFDLTWADSPESARKWIEKQTFDLALVSHPIGVASGLDFIQELRRAGFPGSIITLLGREKQAAGPEALEAGAHDALVKGCFEAPLLERSIRYAIQLKQANLDIEQARDSQQYLADHIEEGLLELDLELNLTGCNRSLEALTGLKLGEAKGRCILDLFPWLQELGVDQKLLTVLSGDTVNTEPHAFEIPGSDRKGWIRERFLPRYDANKQIVSVLGFIEDLTARKQAEEGWQSERKDLKTARENERQESHAKLEALNHEHRAAIETLNQEHQATVESFKQESQAAMEALKREHQAAIETLEQESRAAIEALKQEHQATIESFKQESQAAMEALKRESKAALESARREADARVESEHQQAEARNEQIRLQATEVARVEREQAAEALDAMRREGEEMLRAERKKAEAALADLKHKETELRNYFLSAPTGLLHLDAAGRVIQANRTVASMLAYSPEELAKLTLTDLIVEDASPTARERLTALAEGKTARFEVELRLRQKPSGAIRVRMTAASVTDEAGQFLYTAAALEDITDRHLTEAALRESEARMQNLSAVSPVGIFRTDQEGRCTYLNEKWSELSGQSTDTGRQHGWLAALHDEDRASISALWNEAIRDGSSFTGEFRLQRPDRTTPWVFGQATPERNAQGDFIGHVGTITDITARKETEAALRESESLFQNLAQASPVGIFRTDVAGRCLYVNQRWCELSSLSAEAARGDGWHLAIHPDDRESITSRWQGELRSGEPFSTEFRFQRPDGSVTWVMGQAVPQRDEGGVVTGYMGTVTDITQLKEAEQSLREGEERFRKLIETTFDAIVIHDDGLILDVNREAGSLFGYRPEDILGRNVLDLVSPQSRETVEQRMASGSEDPYEAVVIRRDGSTSIVEIVGRPSVWQGRQVRVVALRDITQRRLAEGEIQKLAAFPRHNPNPVFAFRDDGELIYFNDAASELARSLGEDHPLGILPPDVATLVRQALDSPGHNRELESVVRQRTFAWTFFAIPDQRVIHAYAAEITSRLELENQLRHAQKMESIGQLAAGVAHDFNNILTIIQGHANLLLTYSELPNDSSESLKEISVAAERAARLTRQLLTFSRRQVRQPRPIDLNELIRSLTPMLHASIDPAVTLQINCSTQLPMVHADAGMLEQVVMNLATNARDALSNGGRIAISTASTRIDSQHAQSHAEARAGHFVCLTVADNGSGMSSDTISHLFEPFFTTKEVGKGTGLGLATVYGIVKLHQGWIEVQSTPDKGSTFRVFLPVLVSTTSPAGAATTLPDASAGGETVLVVEDEPGLRHLVRNILNRHGYKVLTACSGVEALKVWEEHHRNIQLLLTDMIMPDGLSGRDLAERLIAQDRHLKVIYTSGYSMDVVGKGSALKEGYNFLQKPYQPPVLAKAIRDCLDS